MKISIILLLLFIVSNSTENQFDYKLKIRSIENCDDDNDGGNDEIVECTTELKNIDGIDMFNARLHLKVPFDDMFKYSLRLQMTDNERYFMSIQGVPSEDFNYLMPGLWEKITTAAGISNAFPIPPGDYRVDNFTISLDECGFPIPIKEKLEIIARILYGDGTVICRRFSLESMDK